jgi:sarcosine oxidase subunit alpha
MNYVPELGGYVPYRNMNLCTSHPDIYVAGDVAGVEEASSAMVEGKLAGLHAAKALGYDPSFFTKACEEAEEQLEALRAGPAGEKIRVGLANILLQEVFQHA